MIIYLVFEGFELKFVHSHPVSNVKACANVHILCLTFDLTFW